MQTRDLALGLSVFGNLAQAATVTALEATVTKLRGALAASRERLRVVGEYAQQQTALARHEHETAVMRTRQRDAARALANELGRRLAESVNAGAAKDAEVARLRGELDAARPRPAE